MPSSPIPSDGEGFRRLFEEHRDPIHRFLCRLTRNATEADDILQETFVTLWRKRGQFRGEGSLAGYLRQIGYRIFLNSRRGLAWRRAPRSMDSEPSSRDPDPHECFLDGDERRQRLADIQTAVNALTEKLRVPFVLFRFEGLSCAEVAEALGLRPKVVELRLARSMKVVAAQATRAEAVRKRHSQVRER